MGYTVRLGDLDLLVVSDGILWLDAGAVFGLVPRVLWEPIVGSLLDDQYRLPVGMNSLVVRCGGQTILIETGAGTKDIVRRSTRPGEHGTLLQDLDSHGIQPQDVDIVINTHLHYDHCGWNTTRQDESFVPTFPNARYLIQRGEWEAATHPNERTRASYLAENLHPLAERGQLELIEGETQVTPEVRIVSAPGHTADTVVVAVTSAGRTALYLGDIVQQPVQLERLAWISAFDVLPLQSLETKRWLQQWAVRDDLLLISGHFLYPGVGRLRLVNERYQWVPLGIT